MQKVVKFCHFFCAQEIDKIIHLPAISRCVIFTRKRLHFFMQITFFKESQSQHKGAIFQRFFFSITECSIYCAKFQAFAQYSKLNVNIFARSRVGSGENDGLFSYKPVGGLLHASAKVERCGSREIMKSAIVERCGSREIILPYHRILNTFLQTTEHFFKSLKETA